MQAIFGVTQIHKWCYCLLTVFQQAPNYFYSILIWGLQSKSQGILQRVVVLPCSGSVNVGVVYTGPMPPSRMCIMNYSCHHVLREVNGQSLKQNTMMREIHNAQCRQLLVEHSLVNQGVKFPEPCSELIWQPSSFCISFLTH